MKYFKDSEFQCTASGEADMNADFLQTLEEIRETLGEPMIITSGYRSDAHPITQAKVDQGKKHGGAHHLGYAVDVAAAGLQAINLLAVAINHRGVTGIGIKQNGPWNSRFIHLDGVPTDNNFGLTRPTIWSY